MVKTGITLQLATCDRLGAGERELLHHAERLHRLWSGTPRHCAAVASTSPSTSCSCRPMSAGVEKPVE